MTDDLVKRLNTTKLYYDYGEESSLGEEAADRIEKLKMQLFSEKALRQSLEETVSIHSQRQNKRIEQLEAALRVIIQVWDTDQPISIARAALARDAACNALEGE